MTVMSDTVQQIKDRLSIVDPGTTSPPAYAEASAGRSDLATGQAWCVFML